MRATVGRRGAGTVDEVYQIMKYGYLEIARDADSSWIIDHDSWVERLDDLGLPRWIMNMTLLAISDFLEPPVVVPPGPKQARWVAMGKLEDRWSAHRWIFNNYEDEFNFAAVCRIFGKDPRMIRNHLLILRNAGIRFPRTSPRKKKADVLPSN